MNQLTRRVAALETATNARHHLMVITDLSAEEIASAEAQAKADGREIVWIDTGISRAPGEPA